MKSASFPWKLRLHCFACSRSVNLNGSGVAVSFALMFESERDIRNIFAEGLDEKKALAVRHKAIWEVLEGASREILRSAECDRKVTLKSILKAAGSVAYLRMPAALAAARCRKTVSHAPRNEVMRRIFRMSPLRRDHNSLGEKGRH